MRPLHRIIVLPVVLALLALASGYACGDDAPPAVDQTRESTTIPVQSASPTAAPPAVSAVVSTPTPTPSVQSPPASPTALPVSTPTPEFGAAREAEAALLPPPYTCANSNAAWTPHSCCPKAGRPPAKAAPTGA